MFVLEQLKALRNFGISPIVVSPVPWAPSLFEFHDGVRKYSVVPRRANVEGFQVIYPRMPALPGGRMFFLYGLLYYLACRQTVHSLARTERIRLLHAHTIMPDGFAAAVLGRELNLPVVCTVHGSDINVYPQRSRATLIATRWALRAIENIVSVSDSLKEVICRLTEQRPIDVVSNGADEQLFNPIDVIAARRQLGIPLEQKVVLFAGNLVPVKGLSVLVEAMSKVRFENAVLFVVGDGADRKLLERATRDKGIENRIFFVGRRPHKEIPVWFSAADCLALSSFTEGFPTVIPEAMMCRLPVVATAVGGIPEIIQHRYTGLLVKPGDPNELAHMIDTALSGSSEIRLMAERAQSMVKHQLTWAANAYKMASIYERVLTHHV